MDILILKVGWLYKLVFVLLFVSRITFALNVLVVSSCYTGHLTPTLAIVRKLFSRGHTADFLTSVDCCQSKIQKGLSTRVQCWDRGFTTLEGVEVNNPLEAVRQVRVIAAENGTGLAFEVVNDYLNQNPTKYDIIIADWAFLGATLAAQLHNIPVVTNYVGTIFMTLEEDPNSRTRLTYVPETYKFFSDSVEFFTAFVYQKLVADPAYDIILSINNKFGMQPKVQNYGLTFLLPTTYYHAFSNLIHIGPPDAFISNKSYMDKKTNVRHVGYIPEPENFRELDENIRNFIQFSQVPVIYISMGTLFQLEISKLRKVLEDLSKQNKYSFIWSASEFYFDNVSSLGLPEDNLIIVKNVAQLTLLLDEKVVAFVTHAGGNSVAEAVYSETPMLVFPGFADQPANADHLVREKMALPLVELTQQEISSKLAQILSPEIYSDCKMRLKKSKELMTSLGGYEKAADVVEQVASGEIKVIDAPKLLNMEQVYNRQLVYYLTIFIFMFSVFIWLVYACCRKICCTSKKNVKKEIKQE